MSVDQFRVYYDRPRGLTPEGYHALVHAEPGPASMQVIERTCKQWKVGASVHEWNVYSYYVGRVEPDGTLKRASPHHSETRVYHEVGATQQRMAEELRSYAKKHQKKGWWVWTNGQLVYWPDRTSDNEGTILGEVMYNVTGEADGSIRATYKWHTYLGHSGEEKNLSKACAAVIANSKDVDLVKLLTDTSTPAEVKDARQRGVITERQYRAALRRRPRL